MATWWKKFKYSRVNKVFIWMLFCIGSILLIYSMIGWTRLPAEKNYYENIFYQQEIARKSGYVRDWIVRYTNPYIFESELITNGQIEEYRKATDLVHEDEIRERIIEDRYDYYNQIQAELIRYNKNLLFLGWNTADNTVVTNIPEYDGTNAQEMAEMLKEKEGHLYGDGSSVIEIGESKVYGYDHLYYTGSALKDTSKYQIYVALKDELVPGDRIYEVKTQFDRTSSIRDEVYLYGMIGAVLTVLSGVYGVSIIGRELESKEIRLKRFDQIPLELKSLYLIIVTGVVGMLIGEWAMHLYYNLDWLPYIYDEELIMHNIILQMLIILGTLVVIMPVTSIIRHIKNKSLVQNLGCIRIGRWFIKTSVSERTISIIWIIGSILYVVLNFVFLALTGGSGGIVFILSGTFWILFNALVFVGIWKICRDYTKIAEGVKALSEGEMNHKIDLKYSLPMMQKTAKQMNQIGQGLEVAVEKSIRSERFKTELITNVSHDLKTPLTSIISYIDLLKEEPIANEQAKEYIEVLDERSQRLKQLVEDLVDASKAATGNVKTNLEPIDLKDLVLQVVGEYTDRLEQNGLEIVYKELEEVSILGDGRHLWRVMENLLSNVCKYAMPKTRVYVEVYREGKTGKCIIKNISKEALGIAPEELFERFTRGDESRHTEGSGLGLSIAQNLVHIQGGDLKLSIDGDLFKIEMSMEALD